MSGIINDDIAELDYPHIDEILTDQNSPIEDAGTLSEIEINVIDSLTGKPIPNAMVSLDTASRTGRCDSSGNANFSKLPKAKLPVDIIVPGYIAASVLADCSFGRQSRIQVKMERNCQLL